MASQLPAFPRIVFTIIEPISLIAGALGVFIDPDWFIASQTPTAAVSTNPNARLVALQLGNLYALLFMLGIAVLHATTELRVVRNYLVAAWIADLGHVGLTCWFLGLAHAGNVGAWNAMTWGNVGFTTFLFLTRTAWFLGLFGPDAPPAAGAQKKKA